MDGDPYANVRWGDEPKGATSPALPPTWAEAGEWDEAAIPPRPWIAPSYLMRGTVTLLIGPPGISKSTMVIAQAVALALNRDLHGFRPLEPRRVAIFNVEDDPDEQKRRLSAALTRLGKRPADVAGSILRTGPTRTGMLFNRDPLTGQVEATPAMQKLERDLVAFRADVLFVDPLAELHGCEENDNNALRAIIAEFRALAVRLNIAVAIVHHTGKGQATPGDPNGARGASSIIGTVRTALTLVGMTKEEAEALGIDPAGAKRFFRLDGAKNNHAMLTDCEWFERVSYTLANGDAAPAAAPWEAPRQVVTADMRLQVEAAIRRGSPTGPWSPKLGDTPRSVAIAMEIAGVVGKVAQRDLLATLEREGFKGALFKDHRRKNVMGIRSPDGLPEAEWVDGADQ